jgi:hypothetical protein
MYFVETGLGEVFKPREQTKTPPRRQPPQPPRKVPPKAPPKRSPDRFIKLDTLWDLWVPFRKDLKTFSREVAKAIGRHAGASEKTKIDSLLVGEQENVKSIHHRYFSSATESDFVHVRAGLRFKKANHTDLDWVYLETGLPLGESIKKF